MQLGFSPKYVKLKILVMAQMTYSNQNQWECNFFSSVKKNFMPNNLIPEYKQVAFKD
jgi:hypothetical protein